jgi:hypothetical protein
MLGLDDVREADRWQPVDDIRDDASFCGAFGAVVRRHTRAFEHLAADDRRDLASAQA